MLFTMKKLKKILAMCLAVVAIVSSIPAVYAADVANATIDTSAKGSLTLYKYDLTNAERTASGIPPTSPPASTTRTSTRPWASPSAQAIPITSPTWATVRLPTVMPSRASSLPT